MNEDTYLKKLLSTTPHKQEALSWLQQKDGKERLIGESNQDMDAPTSLRFVQDLYQQGATEVTAIDVDADTHLETTNTLIVKLPQEALKRKKVFQSEAKIARRGGFGAVADEGQEYLMLHCKEAP